MPTYEYRCENGHEFEEFQSIVAEPIHTCPICGGHAERLISAGSGLIFKGSGFYITDYKGKQPVGETKSRDVPSAGAAAKGAEAKPAAKEPAAKSPGKGES